MLDWAEIVVEALADSPAAIITVTLPPAPMLGFKCRVLCAWCGQELRASGWSCSDICRRYLSVHLGKGRVE